jgi:hypothetical protein
MSVSSVLANIAWTDAEVALVESVVWELAEVIYTLDENPHCNLTEDQISQVRVALQNRVEKLNLMDQCQFAEIVGAFGKCEGLLWDAEKAGY